MSNVQFMADFPQITLGKKTKIVLEIPEGTTFSKIAEIAQHRGERILVQFGQPQMEMDFERVPGGGLVATVNARGEVERIERSEPADDADSDPEDVLVQDGEESEQIEFTDEEADGSGESDDPGEQDDQDEQSGPQDDQESAAEDEEPDVDKEELENFILQERPEFPDIPYNFPELLRRRREENEKWIDLAKEVGIASSRLQAFWNVYKKRVKKMIIANRGAA
jgi:hypothetical protein